jgi:hypothetical protein
MILLAALLLLAPTPAADRGHTASENGPGHDARPTTEHPGARPYVLIIHNSGGSTHISSENGAACLRQRDRVRWQTALAGIKVDGSPMAPPTTAECFPR